MMKISTRGRYATRIMALLAADATQPSLTKYQIAESEAISPAYVQQLMVRLRAAWLVTSYRGRAGGFGIARPADTITVADILAAVEGDVLPIPCRGEAHCDRVAHCPSRPVWEKAAGLLHDLFADITVADMLNTAERRG